MVTPAYWYLHTFVVPFHIVPLCLCDQQNMADECMPLPRLGYKPYCDIYLVLFYCLPFSSLILGGDLCHGWPSRESHMMKNWSVLPITTWVRLEADLLATVVFRCCSSTLQPDCNHMGDPESNHTVKFLTDSWPSEIVWIMHFCGVSSVKFCHYLLCSSR